MSVYLVALRMPVNFVAPHFKMPPHTWKLYECFGLLHNRDGSSLRWYDVFWRDSNSTLHSSVQIMSENSKSLLEISTLQKSSLLTKAQYLVFFEIQPRWKRALFTIPTDTLSSSGYSDITAECSCFEVRYPWDCWWSGNDSPEESCVWTFFWYLQWSWFSHTSWSASNLTPWTCSLLLRDAPL